MCQAKTYRGGEVEVLFLKGKSGGWTPKAVWNLTTLGGYSLIYLATQSLALVLLFHAFLSSLALRKVVMTCGSSCGWVFNTCSLSFGIVRDLALDKLFYLPIFPSFITIPTTGVVVSIKYDDTLRMSLAQCLVYSNSLISTSY